MKKIKQYRNIFICIGLVLYAIMCFIVASGYWQLVFGGIYAGYSAPASIAFLYGIPFLIGILVCIGFVIYFQKKLNKENKEKDSE